MDEHRPAGAGADRDPARARMVGRQVGIMSRMTSASDSTDVAFATAAIVVAGTAVLTTIGTFISRLSRGLTVEFERALTESEVGPRSLTVPM